MLEVSVYSEFLCILTLSHHVEEKIGALARFAMQSVFEIGIALEVLNFEGNGSHCRQRACLFF
jgi:hypothetical protein